jgi:DNA-directed RNA polymerase specialized sigma24 family protein
MNLQAIKDAQAGTGLDSFFDEIEKAILPTCVKRYGQLGDDVAQDAMLRIFLSFRNIEFVNVEHFFCWVWKVVSSRHCDCVRREVRHRKVHCKLEIEDRPASFGFEVAEQLSLPKYDLLRLYSWGFKQAELGKNKSQVHRELKRQRMDFVRFL